MSTFTCTECNKSFATALGLAGHSRMHGNSGGTNKQIMCCCVITRNEVRATHLTQYQNSLISCKLCNKLFKSEYKAVFCSRSCATTYTNQFKVKSAESNLATSISLKLFNTHNPRPKKAVAVSPLKRGSKSTNHADEPKTKQCKIRSFERVCYHCTSKFESKLKKKYCSSCSPMYMAEARNRFKFTFNVFKYPDLFDLTLLKEVGFYAPRGKSGSWNPNGLSRDHRVSVNEAIKNNYDPYYITHPVNCELMPHYQNNSKKTKNSLSYQDLISVVDDYDQRNGS